jgi:hypothetical protein
MNELIEATWVNQHVFCSENLNDVKEISGDSIPDPGADDEKIPPEAVVHERRGELLLWGTQDDLTCAEWMVSTRAKAFRSKGLSTPQRPEYQDMGQ